MLGVLAQISEVIASIGILIAVVSLTKEIRSQNLNNFFYLHEYLSQMDFSSARKHVRTSLYKKPYAEWSEEDRQDANQVCASYDQAGILLNNGIIDKKTKKVFLKSSWGQSIIDQYEALAPFLADQQTPHLTGEEFFHHFSELYQAAKKMQRR